MLLQGCEQTKNEEKIVNNSSAQHFFSMNTFNAFTAHDYTIDIEHIYRMMIMVLSYKGSRM